VNQKMVNLPLTLNQAELAFSGLSKARMFDAFDELHAQDIPKGLTARCKGENSR
jgi:hypothetical protein